MRRLLILAVLALSLTPRASVAGSSADPAPAQALVRFKPGTPAVAITAAHARVQARVVRSIPIIGYQLIAFDPALPLDTVLTSYRNDPAITSAEPNYAARLASDDPCLTGSCAGQAKQWALSMTNAFGTGAFTAAQKKSLPPVTVAVLDTKIDSTHPDFANAGSSSRNAADGGQLDLANAKDWIAVSAQRGAAEYHGSYVAGLVAAATNNGTGIASIGARATILPLTVVDGAGRADAASLADAIVYAWQKGARIINLSLGLTSDSAAVHDAIRAVTSGSRPSLVVAAAGNNTGSAPFYPGSYPEVMSVSGTSPSDQPAVCSNHNGNVSVAAPAEKVVSLNAGGGYVAPPCGTSAAAPQVSGLAANLFAQDAARTPAQVRAIIERSSDDLGAPGRDNRFGHGRINAERALASGPSATLARTTIPPSGGGASLITATASSSRGVREARVRIGSPTATPVALSAADGAFGGTTESLRGSVVVPPSLSVGAHAVYVQAFDGSMWGPNTVGVLLIDGKPPVISSPAATNATRLTATASTISFTLGDDTSPTLTYGIQVFDAANKEVFRDHRTAVPQGPASYSWTPGPNVLPGSYQVKIIAVDQAGKSSATIVGTLVA